MNKSAPTIQPSTLEPVSVSVAQAASLLGLSKSMIWVLIGDGRLECVHIGRRALVPYASVKALISDAA